MIDDSHLPADEPMVCDTCFEQGHLTCVSDRDNVADLMVALHHATGDAA